MTSATETQWAISCPRPAGECRCALCTRQRPTRQDGVAGGRQEPRTAVDDAADPPEHVTVQCDASVLDSRDVAVVRLQPVRHLLLGQLGHEPEAAYSCPDFLRTVPRLGVTTRAHAELLPSDAPASPPSSNPRQAIIGRHETCCCNSIHIVEQAGLGPEPEPTGRALLESQNLRYDHLRDLIVRRVENAEHPAHRCEQPWFLGERRVPARQDLERAVIQPSGAAQPVTAVYTVGERADLAAATHHRARLQPDATRRAVHCIDCEIPAQRTTRLAAAEGLVNAQGSADIVPAVAERLVQLMSDDTQRPQDLLREM